MMTSQSTRFTYSEFTTSSSTNKEKKQQCAAAIYMGLCAFPTALCFVCVFCVFCVVCVFVCVFVCVCVCVLSSHVCVCYIYNFVTNYLHNSVVSL
jgi:hypothetical protein